VKVVCKPQWVSGLQPQESTLYQGDAEEILRQLPSCFFRCVVTSPPYWGLRDYAADGQLGAEDDPREYVSRLVRIFEEIRRILRDDGTVWLNLGDCYTSGNRSYRAPDRKHPVRAMSYRAKTPPGLKPKDLVGVPWRVAFALQDAGWYLRCDVIWEKPNCMPESVKDRPTRSHEYIFLLSKSLRYFYRASVIAEPPGKNKRSVWTVPTEPFNGPHFATFPTRLIHPCILASTEAGDWVLDPFFGSGTVGVVCEQLGRRYVGIELNPQYVELASRRIAATQRPLFIYEPRSDR
jgi:site-specific DNA-methyltransferase (adenine-specific)